MSTGLDRLRRNYKPALLSYVGHRSEVGLHAAYELGRSALAARVSLLDLVQIHHDVLVDVLTTARDDEVRDLFCAGATFLVEALAAADMAQRGFVETASGTGGSARWASAPTGERPVGREEKGAAMSHHGEHGDTDPQGSATPEQEQQVRELAEQAGEDVPSGMRSAEAAQRLEELSTQSSPPSE